MSEQSPLDTLVATFVGAVLFSAVIVAVATGHKPSPPAISASGAVVTLTSSFAQVVTLETPAPTATATPQPAPPTAIPTVQPTATPEPTAIVIEPEDHYWFSRPIASNGVNFVSRFYAYGATYHGRYQVHHGVEFENPTGTPIMAVGSGRVITAGTDETQVYGQFPNFYGRLIIIEHDRTYYGQPVYTLYGHLNSEKVEVGQQVDIGQVIGEVGSTGIALGPHLHMEVRVGKNTYAATRNPELWIQPFEGYGTIAGRLLDADGTYIPGALVNLFDSENTWRREAETYGEGVNPDDGWKENFVFGDVPAGRYIVHYEFDGAVHTAPIDVKAGQTTLVTLKIPAAAKPQPEPPRSSSKPKSSQ